MDHFDVKRDDRNEAKLPLNGPLTGKAEINRLCLQDIFCHLGPTFASGVLDTYDIWWFFMCKQAIEAPTPQEEPWPD